MARIWLTTLLLMSATSAWAECRVVDDQKGWITFGSGTTHRMTLKQGESCGDFLSSVSGQSNFGAPRRFQPTFTGARVVERPRHGVAATSGVSRYAYQPAPGFTGRDAFVIELSGESDASRGVYRIAVEVEVQR